MESRPKLRDWFQRIPLGSLDPRLGIAGLAILFILGMVASRWIGWYEHQVRVEGEIYNRIIEDKKIVEIIQTLSLDNEYFYLMRLVHETDPLQQWERGVEFQTLRDHYELRHRNSLDAITNAKEREKFATIPHDRAIAFFRAVESNILSKLQKNSVGDTDTTKPNNDNSKLTAIVQTEIDPLFDAYRNTMQELLDHARQKINIDEDDSLNSTLRWAGMRAIFDFCMLTTCLLFCWFVYRRAQYLTDQKNRLASITSATPNAILLTDRQGDIQWINQSFSKMFGYSYDECKGQRFGEFLKSENTEPYMASRLNDAIRNGDPCHAEFAARSRDGKEHIVEIELQPTLDANNRTNGFIAIQTDRTDSVKLRQRLNSIFRTIAEGVVLHGRDGKIFDCNLSAERILGLSRSQILGRDPKDPRWRCIRADGTIWEGNTHPAMEALNNGIAVRNSEMGVQLPSGELRWISINAHPVQNLRGETDFVIASFSDITSLRQHTEQLEHAIGGAKLITWDWQIEPNRLMMRDLQATSDNQFEEFTKESWLARTHPDDLPNTNRLLEEHMSGRSTDYRSERRVADRQGNWIWILEAGRIVERNTAGRPARMSGIQLDISENKELEKLFREGELRHVQANDAALDAIISMNDQGIVTGWNKEASVCFGWTQEEALGRKLSELIIPEADREAHENGMKRFLNTGVSRIVGKRIEVVGQRKDGSAIPIELSLLCVRNAETTFFTAYLRDISDRRQLLLQASHAQLLESIGSVTSGVAHEINTPVQYANDSCHFIRDGLRDLLNLLDQYRILKKNSASGKVDAPRATLIEKVEEELDIPYLATEMPKAVDRAIDGLGRIGEIVQSLKDFAFQTPSEFILCDINRLITNLLIVSRSEYASVADIETQFEKLPETLCYPGEFNQVFLKLLFRATDAIRSLPGSASKKGQIKIVTKLDANQIVISCLDNGKPIDAEVASQTGSSHPENDDLSWVRDAVSNKLRGSLTMSIQAGKGTLATLRIPVHSSPNTSN